jgi:hypothetical protein
MTLPRTMARTGNMRNRLTRITWAGCMLRIGMYKEAYSLEKIDL